MWDVCYTQYSTCLLLYKYFIYVKFNIFTILSKDMLKFSTYLLYNIIFYISPFKCTIMIMVDVYCGQNTNLQVLVTCLTILTNEKKSLK